MVPAVTETPDGACNGHFPASGSRHFELILYRPKTVAPVLSLATNRWQLRYWASKIASLFKAVSVTLQTAIHYHSNEPATMEGKKYAS